MEESIDLSNWIPRKIDSLDEITLSKILEDFKALVNIRPELRTVMQSSVMNYLRETFVRRRDLVAPIKYQIALNLAAFCVGYNFPEKAAATDLMVAGVCLISSKKIIDTLKPLIRDGVKIRISNGERT